MKKQEQTEKANTFVKLQVKSNNDRRRETKKAFNNNNNYYYFTIKSEYV